MQGSLGAAYEFGWGVQVNKAQAVRYYQGAAAKGDTTAMVALGKLAENGEAGEALPRDAAEALRCRFQAPPQWLTQRSLAPLTAYARH